MLGWSVIVTALTRSVSFLRWKSEAFKACPVGVPPVAIRYEAGPSSGAETHSVTKRSNRTVILSQFAFLAWQSSIELSF